MNINEKIAQLGSTEKQLIELQVDRLLQGQKEYGRLNLDTDTREFTKELLEEILDGMQYLSMDLLRRK